MFHTQRLITVDVMVFSQESPLCYTGRIHLYRFVMYVFCLSHASEKDTNTDSISVCTQQSLHLLFHIRGLDVLQESERLGYMYCSSISLTLSHTRLGSSWPHARKHISD